jgi:MFS family permease
MSEKLNLKELERKAWRSFFDDGLWDIYLGLLLASMGVNGLLDRSGLTEDWGMTIYIGVLVVTMLSFWLAKRFITVPRIGRVKFGHKRKVRRIKTALVLFASVVFGLIVMLLTSATRNGIASGNPWRAIMPAIWAINMLVVFGAMGYFLDFERLYFIGLMYAIAIPINEILIALEGIRIGPYLFFACGAIIVAMGIFYLVRFLNNYSVIQEQS